MYSAKYKQWHAQTNQAIRPSAADKTPDSPPPCVTWGVAENNNSLSCAVFDACRARQPRTVWLPKNGVRAWQGRVGDSACDCAVRWRGFVPRSGICYLLLNFVIINAINRSIGWSCGVEIVSERAREKNAKRYKSSRSAQCMVVNPLHWQRRVREYGSCYREDIGFLFKSSHLGLGEALK